MESLTTTVRSSVATPVSLAAPVQNKISHKEAPNPPPQHLQKKVSIQDVEHAIQQVRTELAGANEDVSFSYEKKLGQLFVQIKDNVSGEVIREVPSKDFIQHQVAMKEMIGLLLDKQI